MKRLFIVRLVSGTAGKGWKRGPVKSEKGIIQCFATKDAAKMFRDSLSETYPKGVFCVSPGPDHWRWAK